MSFCSKIPKVSWIGGTEDKPLFRDVGDPVANGVLYFTTFTSNKLVAVDARTGRSLKEIDLGPVLCGPSVSRGRVYVGTGNTHFNESPEEAYFPKRNTGFVYSFGLAEEGEVDPTIKYAVSTVDVDRPLTLSSTRLAPRMAR